MNRLVLAATSTALALGATAFGSSTASFASTPKLMLSIINRSVNADQSATVRYRLEGAGQGDKLYVERAEGTAQVWKIVKKLPGLAGVSALPGVPQGEYKYRLIALNKSRQLVALSPVKLLFSYASIALSVDINSSISTVQVGSQIFSYAMSDGSVAGIGSYNQLINQKSTTCKSISLEIAATPRQDLSTTDNPGTDEVSIVQASADPQSVSVPENQTVGFNATLNGGPWILEDSTTVYETYEYFGTENASPNLYFDGSLDCYTPTGAPTGSSASN